MKLYNVLKNIINKIKNTGTYTLATGTLTTKAWDSAQNCVKWYAPEDGIYLMQMSMYPATDQQGAAAYKQFRWTGDVTSILQENTMMYWLGSASQGLCGIEFTFPVIAKKGQYVTGYIWTGTAGITFNVRIAGVYLAKVGGVVHNLIASGRRCVA